MEGGCMKYDEKGSIAACGRCEEQKYMQLPSSIPAEFLL
jgi:hypothetical protein